MNNGILVDKLYDEDGNLICDEMYYHFYDNTKPSPAWVEGLKWVYDAYDKSGKKDFEAAIEFLDDDQEDMVAALSYLILKDRPAGRLIGIFANYMFNEDGSKNLIKQVCLIFEFGGTSYLVIRTPHYAFTDKLKEIANKIDAEAK